MAVKKTAKKPVKKAAVKKSTAKKSVAKKSVAKKAVAKKAVAKKAVKKTAKKAVAKKAVAKKSVAKKTVAKKAAPKKRAVKKSAAKKSTTANVVVPPVPTTGSRDRVNVSTTPAAPVKQAAPVAPTKPSAAPRQKTSRSVLLAVLLGVAIIAAVAASQSKSSDDANTTEPTAIESASATPSASETASAEPSTSATAAVASGEAPSRFIGNWKDADHTVLTLTWRAPAGDVTGYKVEINVGQAGWTEVAQLPSTELSADLTKTGADSWTQFRVSAVYSDGSIGTAKAFGFKGTFK